MNLQHALFPILLLLSSVIAASQPTPSPPLTSTLRSPFRTDKTRMSTVRALSGDLCRNIGDCNDPLLCLGQSEVAGFSLCTTQPICLCVPRTGFAQCSSRSTCPAGELCACARNDSSPSCLSQVIVKADNNLQEVTQDGNCPAATSPVSDVPNLASSKPTPASAVVKSSPSPSATMVTTPVPSSTGMIQSSTPQGSIETNATQSQIALLGNSTNTDMTTPDFSPSGAGASTTPSATQMPSATPTKGSSDNSAETSVCIDARALAHLHVSELVFKKHRNAAVLCDLNDSCATPGHIVIFEGKSMMMSSYCKIATCNAHQMLVNSPKYKRKLYVDSRTEGLKFTAFAARYESQLEESLLSAAVRFGG